MSAATSSRSCATFVEIGIGLVKEERRRSVKAKAEMAAEERVLDALVGPGCEPGDRATRSERSSVTTSSTTRRSSWRCRRAPEACRCSNCLACPAPRWARSRSATCSARPSAGAPSRGRITVGDAYEPLNSPRESDKLLDQGGADPGRQSARWRTRASSSFDEIDKVCAREGRSGADVSREGVQRDLLPLIEGTTVTTKHGPVKTDQHPVHRVRRLPRLEALRPLAGAAGAAAHPRRAVLARRRRLPPHPHRDRGEPDQAVGGPDADGGRGPLVFTEDGIDALARIAVEVNSNVEKHRGAPPTDRDRAHARRDLFTTRRRSPARP